MTRHTINDKHGKPTDYFWSDEYAADPSRATVFRQTEKGVKKMTGVTYDSKAGKIVKG
ncbi:MAG: hypothetical protein ACT4O1_15645 [Gemmatimonadota bacterium]